MKRLEMSDRMVKLFALNLILAFYLVIGAGCYSAYQLFGLIFH